MPAEPNLEVHDVAVSEQSTLNLAGGVERTVLLRFHVGPHGPFIRQFRAQDATSERLRAEIDHQVVELRRLFMPEAGS